MKPISTSDCVIWVSLPRATFGIVIRDERVVDGGTLRQKRGLRLIGMNEHQAAEKLRRLGARFAPLPQERSAG